MRIVGKTNVNIITGNKYECGGNISSYKDNPIKTFEYSYVYFFFIFFKVRLHCPQISPHISKSLHPHIMRASQFSACTPNHHRRSSRLTGSAAPAAAGVPSW